MKTEKRFYVEGTNLEMMDNSDELRKFAEKIGYSDFEVSEKNVSFLEDGEKIIITYCVGGSEDENGIHTGGTWIDITGTWEQGVFETGTFKSDCGKYELSVGSDMSYNGFPYKNVRIVEEKKEEETEIIYTGSDKISQDCMIGTREEWELGLKDVWPDWWNGSEEQNQGMTIEEYSEHTLDNELTEADDDQIKEYERFE